MYTIEFKKKPEPKAVTLTELLTWKTKLLEMEKNLLLEANNSCSETGKEYNEFNANVIRYQLSFLERLINQAAEKGERK